MSKKYPNMLEKFQQEIAAWAYRNFGKTKGLEENEYKVTANIDAFLGMVEEMGELAHAILKRRQGIRTNENHGEMEKDAIGDLIIYTLDYCSRRDLDASEILKRTWETVSKRDWASDPINGTVNVELDPTSYKGTFISKGIGS